ncbi:ceramide synthase 4-like [Mya arenaria]|uniref:ceramide synthase 4-like n=1 Tax=Mya arenaria TaxID=6604 RepID=UPI0022E7E08C|nr:ceramide synthase 4-like [Mya arenaria]XP_052803603.1 ceramide synthase 4-like [Mya arenaria]
MMSNTSIYDKLWDDSIWFPVRFHHEDGSVDTALGWSQLVNKPGTNTYYPKVHDLHFGILVGVVLVIIRYVLETLLIIPLGYKLGIKKKKLVYVNAIPSLEEVYKTKKKPDDKQCMGLSKQLDMPLRQVQVWFRNKRNNDLTPPIKKFCDNAWSFLFYTCSFIYGATILWNKSWIWRTKDCWTNWPKQHVTTDLYWYYTVELGFYCSLLFTIFTDHKRKDFKEMTMHHLATISLLYFSWLVNFVRMGSFVLIIHDIADPWLSLAKMGIYLKWDWLKNGAFGLFVILWFITRTFVFPGWLIYSTAIEIFHFIDEPFFVYYFVNVFLLILQVLSLLWSWSIGKIIYNTLFAGGAEDIRSDTEEGDSLSSNGDLTQNGTTNGVDGSVTSADTIGHVNGANATSKVSNNGVIS